MGLRNWTGRVCGDADCTARIGTSVGTKAELAAPVEVREILERRCEQCHSDEPRLSWFDQVAPAYWLVAHDVRTARSRLNFSELGTKPPAVQRAELFEAVNMIQLGAMPLPSYRAAHPGSDVTAEELATLRAYLNPFAPDGLAAMNVARHRLLPRRVMARAKERRRFR